jgi:hypothetical protein
MVPFFYRGESTPLYFGKGGSTPSSSNKRHSGKTVASMKQTDDTATVVITKATHNKLKKYAQKRGLKIGPSVDAMIRDYICGTRKLGI